MVRGDDRQERSTYHRPTGVAACLGGLLTSRYTRFGMSHPIPVLYCAPGFEDRLLQIDALSVSIAHHVNEQVSECIFSKVHESGIVHTSNALLVLEVSMHQFPRLLANAQQWLIGRLVRK